MVSDTNQVTTHTIERTTTKETVKEAGSDWLHVTITFWPIVAIVGIICFRQQVAQLLQDLAGLTFGSFSLKLRKRVSKFADHEQYAKIQRLSAHDLKCFFIVASQSWRIDGVHWRGMPIQENLAMHQRLEDSGLIRITNKGTATQHNSVDSTVTPLGEEFYQELTSVIAESIK